MGARTIGAAVDLVGNAVEARLGADGHDDVARFEGTSGHVVGVEAAGEVADAQHDGPGLASDCQVVDGLALEGAVLGEEDLAESGLVGTVVHDDVEEVGDVRLRCQARHARSPDLVRVDHPVGADLEHLGERLLVVAARDDEQVRVEAACRQRDVEVVDARPEGGDEGRRPVDAGLAQDLLLTGVAEHVEEVDAVELRGILVDGHNLLADRTDEVGDRAADSPHATHDQVAGQVVDGSLHAIPPVLAGDPAFDDALDHSGGPVQHGAGAYENQHRGEDLPGVARLAGDQFAKAHGRDRDNRLVEGVDRIEAEEAVSKGSRRHHADDQAGCPQEVVPRTGKPKTQHSGRVGAIVGR